MSIIKTTIAGGLLATLGACASGPDTSTFGGALQVQGGNLEPIGSDWTRGAELIAQGQERKTDGERELDRARNLERSGNRAVSRADREIAQGQQLQAQAERRYCGQTIRIADATVACQ